MRTLFISDLHLEESRPEITAAFLTFIEELEADVDALYILGDLFEAWIGDDENTPLQVKVKTALGDLVSKSCPVYFIHGNRDFLIGQRFAEETGVQLLPDPSLIDLYGEPVLILHGDSLCTRDIAYMKFRQNMRNPEWQSLFLNRPLQDRRTTAQQLRTLSQAQNQGKKQEIMDVTEDEVIKLMSDKAVVTMVHGHTHRPDIHEISVNGKKAKRIVLGDWDQLLWYLNVTPDGEKQLIKQPI
jgi:UDP-2,3-diacylglucosamine hydrolase